MFSDAALELIYNICNPEKEPIGLAVYEEIEGGDHRFGSESKLIAQLIAAVLVIGSYYAARHFGGTTESSVEAGVPPAQRARLPPEV